MRRSCIRTECRDRIIALVLACTWLAGPSLATAQETEGAPQDSLPADSTSAEAVPEVTLGGGLRQNYSWQNYNDARKDRLGDFGFEVFMATVNGTYEDIFVSAQYRWYADFQTIRYGFVGFKINPSLEGHVGVHQAPFGILPWASHSFWFGATYYVGFEDDYDSGLKLIYENGPWNLQAAFYKNAEYLDTSRNDRYSFDLVTGGEQANSEVNQWNVRAARTLNWSPEGYVTIGASGMRGGIYNDSTTRTGDRWAGALHTDFHFGPWNVQLQGIRYQFNPENPTGVDDSTIQFGAFGFPFLVASDAWVSTFNVARDFQPDWRFLESAKCYADLSKVSPIGDNTHTSTQVVTGCMLVKGGLYTFVDWVTGQNMWFIGGPGIGLSTPESDDWKGRLNINFAYYF